MGKIYIIGLGPGSIDALTLGAVDRINAGDKNFLRTENHPTVKYFENKNIPYKSYDFLYDKGEEFDEVYEKIALDLIEESKNHPQINYFVPGNPLVAEKTVEILINKDIDIEIISGMSFIEPMIELVGRDPINGLKIVDGAEFNSLMVDINSDTIITQVYNHRILSEIKLILSEIYGDEYKVYLIHSAGIKEDEKKYFIPIYELDRVEEIGPLTSIYVPEMAKIDKKVFDFNDLLGIIKILRSENGCPWDMEQTHESMRQCLIEEAYEVVDAIDKKDMDGLMEELGDLLLQIIFHGEIAFEEGEFNLYDITSTLAQKLIYRHPHVFVEKSVENSQEVVYNWNMLKYAKRDIHNFTDKLRNIPKLPALMTSFKIQEKAAEVGFDWEDIKGPLDKVMEEYKEVIEAMEQFGGGGEKTEEELGDLIFAVVNLSRFLNVNPEIALNRTINKFIKRFEFIEERLKEAGKNIEDANLDEMDSLWNAAKIHKIH
ncbi:nucleoside triphosphate pyrophosphohydrolase [Tissierella sp. MB52-C2]|uniref:nucleoside triphosphate pyrophosphohydrolase n=1 Tax=Tissierella sp. MB52-C2 TaxID=3070999 RepID=UPI00280BD62E|nr:nucleoside triphosphate pyrophosphohydrolase [Tissierella sp. MB52-C2]WMM25407.1 nucleoside triphosphate pyrophosphohydrolase [Tissierella sp. MB52-C2]